jgi:hypothetical protein
MARLSSSTFIENISGARREGREANPLGFILMDKLLLSLFAKMGCSLSICDRPSGRSQAQYTQGCQGHWHQDVSILDRPGRRSQPLVVIF